jgi:non-homologous end joining protein Ku
MKGQKIDVAPAEEPESTKVIDLMSRLQASLEQTVSKKGKKSRTRKSRTA